MPKWYAFFSEINRKTPDIGGHKIKETRGYFSEYHPCNQRHQPNSNIDGRLSAIFEKSPAAGVCYPDRSAHQRHPEREGGASAGERVVSDRRDENGQEEGAGHP